MARYNPLSAPAPKAENRKQKAETESPPDTHHAPRTAPAPALPRSDAPPAPITITIKEAQHTKRLVPIWIAQLSAKVERPIYNEYANRAQLLGGYYSRFGPVEMHGFVFFDQESAIRFAGKLRIEDGGSKIAKQDPHPSSIIDPQSSTPEPSSTPAPPLRLTAESAMTFAPPNHQPSTPTPSTNIVPVDFTAPVPKSAGPAAPTTPTPSWKNRFLRR